MSSDGASLWEEKACLIWPMTKNPVRNGFAEVDRIIHHVQWQHPLLPSGSLLLAPSSAPDSEVWSGEEHGEERCQLVILSRFEASWNKPFREWGETTLHIILLRLESGEHHAGDP